MNIRDPEVQKISLVSTFLVGLLYMFFFTTYVPFTFKSRSRALAEQRTRYERLQTEVAQAKAAIDRLPELEREVAVIHQRWEEVRELLPAERETAGFLTRMTVAGQESGVDFTLVEPVAPVDHEFYTAYPTRVQVEGGYHQVGRFLAEVGNLSRIVQVRDLQLTTGPTAGEEDGATVTAAFLAEAYASKETPGAPAPTVATRQ